MPVRRRFRGFTQRFVCSVAEPALSFTLGASGIGAHVTATAQVSQGLLRIELCAVSQRRTAQFAMAEQTPGWPINGAGLDLIGARCMNGCSSHLLQSARDLGSSCVDTTARSCAGFGPSLLVLRRSHSCLPSDPVSDGRAGVCYGCCRYLNTNRESSLLSFFL